MVGSWKEGHGAGLVGGWHALDQEHRDQGSCVGRIMGRDHCRELELLEVVGQVEGAEDGVGDVDLRGSWEKGAGEGQIVRATLGNERTHILRAGHRGRWCWKR